MYIEERVVELLPKSFFIDRWDNNIVAANRFHNDKLRYNFLNFIHLVLILFSPFYQRTSVVGLTNNKTC